MKQFTKNDLRTGDIILGRDNSNPGIVITEKEVIVYKNGGYDSFDDFDDTLHFDYGCGDHEPAYDIIKVYTTFDGSVLDFSNYLDDGELVFENTEPYSPSETKTANTEIIKKKDTYAVLAQAFYGNRTITRINNDELDELLLGYPHEIEPEKCNQTFIKLPNAENLYVVYNKFEETEALEKKQKWFEEDGYVTKPLAIIPEQNFEIYSRCILCKLDENHQLCSILPEDIAYVENYFAW